MNVLFVDDRPEEIFSLWNRSGCDRGHELLPIECFRSIERVLELVEQFQPDVILVGHGIGSMTVTGVEVMVALQNSGYPGQLVANSGGGIGGFTRNGVQVQYSVDRNAQKLTALLAQLSRKDG